MGIILTSGADPETLLTGGGELCYGAIFSIIDGTKRGSVVEVGKPYFHFI